MKKIDRNIMETVSVIITMRNASTTLLYALQSIVKQRYPILEIIVIDNCSTDNSCELVTRFARTSKIPIRLIRQKEDRGVSGSFNRGARAARAPLIVFMTSDASLPTEFELRRLTDPFRKDPLVLAAYSQNTLPLSVWENYNFWEKLYSCRQVGSTRSLFVLKFDCIRKETFLKIGGFDEKVFGDDTIGGEDADISVRIRKHGKMVQSDAISYHLHYMGDHYSLWDILKSKKIYGRTYGRVLKNDFMKSPLEVSIFMVKPILAFLPFIPKFHIVGILLLIGYAFVISKRMFYTVQTLANPRILLVPILNIFFLYYEVFWMIESMTRKKN